jgi:lipopolysaccharide export system permease protein
LSSLQSYLMRQCLGPLLGVLGGLAGIAILTQALQRLDILMDRREAGLTYLGVTLLATPQLISLILPLAIFFAVTYALNRLHTENETVLAFSVGLSKWQVLSPLIRLTTICALVHLALNLFVQPAAYREMRQSLSSLQTDIAATFIKEGQFTSPAKGVTVYASRTIGGGRLVGVLISDARNPEQPVTYTAASGLTSTINGQPALVLSSGEIQRLGEGRELDVLRFEQYVFDLSSFARDSEQFVLKASDRYLPELFKPDPTSFWDVRNAERLYAEGHNRLASPLLNFAMVVIAFVTILGGQISRLGYGRRIAYGAAAALFVRAGAMGVEAACRDDASLNVLQYAWPILATAIALNLLLRESQPKGASSRPGAPRKEITFGGPLRAGGA